jgi:phosphotriesterase-related protein
MLVIETVLGPVPADSLGPTSFHDHLLSDAATLRRDGSLPRPASDRVGPATRQYLRTNMLALVDNLRLDDAETAVRELDPAFAAGQRAVVDPTSWGLGPDHAGLPEIARRTGMTIIRGYGDYVIRTLPRERLDLGEDGWEADFLAALREHVPGAGYRAGMLGILGTTGELPPVERALLRAAARAAARTAAAVSVRLDPDRVRGIEVLEICAAEGLAADRVVFTNADEYPDAGLWDELAAAGAVLEMCFGTEDSHGDRVVNLTDAERVDFFVAFCATHPASRHVLGQSVWTKTQLRAYGGRGYGHLFGAIVPALRAAGVPAERLDAMLVDEPRRLLDRPAADPLRR